MFEFFELFLLLRSFHCRYESAIRESTLTRLERDRAMGQIVSLRCTLNSLHGVTGGIPTGPSTRATTKLDGDTRPIEEVINEPGITESMRSNYIFACSYTLT